jgi:hypothetical protein
LRNPWDKRLMHSRCIERFFHPVYALHAKMRNTCFVESGCYSMAHGLMQPASAGGIMWCGSGVLQLSTWASCSMTRDTGILQRRAVGGDTPKITIFTDEDRLDLPWKPGEDDRRYLGAGLRGLDHSFLHDQQWLPGWPPVRRGSAFRCTTLPSRTWNVLPGVLVRQRHVPRDLLL